jgi:suppressor for copper-sensitivity B
LGVSALFVIAYSEPPSTNRSSKGQLINTASSGDKILWQEFSPHLIPKMVKNGNLIFVDVTADWCLTCQINKNTLLSSEPIKALLSDKNTIKMKADWTLPNPTILSYLESYNRFGIPFNVIYGPGAIEGVVLPELLSESNILTAFKDALGPKSFVK